MIRAFEKNDLSTIMQIWLDTNIKAHAFIQKEYWTCNYEAVKNALPQAEIFVYENDSTKQINGFIGLSGNYIEGFFVQNHAQSQGIGKQLLDYVKCLKSDMNLRVYKENIRAIKFYQREQFVIFSESIDENTNQKEYLMAWKK